MVNPCITIITSFDKLNNTTAREKQDAIRFDAIRTLHTPTTHRETDENRDAHRDATGISLPHRDGFETAKNTRVWWWFERGVNDDRSISFGL